MDTLFNCSQADFIIVVNAGLNSYREYLPQFTSFSPKYTVEWGNNLQTAVDAVQMMPIEDARRAESEAPRWPGGHLIKKISRSCQLATIA